MFKFIHRYVRGRWERYYLKSHWHLVLDLSMFIIIIMLLASFSVFYLYHPNIFWLNYSRPAVDLNNPPLNLDFSVPATVIRLGQGSEVKFTYKNDATVAASNLILDLSAVGRDFSLDHIALAASSSAAVVSGREVVISQIPAGTGGEVDLQVYFNRENNSARTINWQVQSQYVLGGQTLKTSDNLPAINISGEIKITDDAYYTSPLGDQLGIGPIPPIVGIPTNYWIFWSAKSDSDFNSVVLNARLPQGVELAPGRSLLAGDFSYSSSTRQLIWKLPTVSGGSDSYRLGFEVRIIPTAAQVGKILTLLNTLQYYAIDTLTGTKSSGTLPPLTTNLDSDRFNVGQGKVISQ